MKASSYTYVYVPLFLAVNGTCELPGECVCYEGYEGELCTESKLYIVQIMSSTSCAYYSYINVFLSEMQLSSGSHDSRVTYLVVGVVLGVAVVTVVTMVTVVLVVLWVISGKKALPITISGM